MNYICHFCQLNCSPQIDNQFDSSSPVTWVKCNPCNAYYQFDKDILVNVEFDFQFNNKNYCVKLNYRNQTTNIFRWLTSTENNSKLLNNSEIAFKSLLTSLTPQNIQYKIKTIITFL